MSQLKVSAEELDFADQMKVLAEQAQHQIESRAALKAYPSLLEALRPLVLGIEALGRATKENTNILSKLEKFSGAQEALPTLMGSIQENLDQKNAINQKLFDALHDELRGYKDGLLLEIFHKPLVRDLITLFDDLASIHRLIEGAEPDNAAPVAEPVKNIGTNLDHTMHFLLEVLARLDVTRMENSTGKLDRSLHRAVSVEAAETEEEDNDIVKSLRPGFTWRGRVVRPEEVSIKKWKEGYLVAMPVTPAS